MRLRSWRGTTPLSTSDRPPFPWARILLLLGVLALAAYLILPRFFFVQADALVQGDLVPVSPIYRVRIDKLLVACNDHVTAGQKLALVSNFLLQADYQRQYLESQQQQQLSQIALDQSVAAAQETAAALRDKYVSSSLEAQKVGDTFRQYDQAYREGVVARVDWQAKKTELSSDVAAAQSARESWQRAEGQVSHVAADQQSKIASDRAISGQSQSLAQRVGSEALVAPVSGYIVGCVDRPQNVVEPSTPIFNIFAPDRTYVLAYFDAGSVSKIHLGQHLDVSISGVPQTLSGRVVSIYPDLVKLPPQLTKFFWQHVQFSEYRPVKVSLDNLDAKERELLYYDAQARVSARIRDSGGRPVPASKN